LWTTRGRLVTGQAPFAFLESPGCFSVEEGALKFSGGRAHLCDVGGDSKASFTDFESKLKVKTSPAANGGMDFYTEHEDKGRPSKGYECQAGFGG